MYIVYYNLKNVGVRTKRGRPNRAVSDDFRNRLRGGVRRPKQIENEARK